MGGYKLYLYRFRKVLHATAAAATTNHERQSMERHKKLVAIEIHDRFAGTDFGGAAFISSVEGAFSQRFHILSESLP